MQLQLATKEKVKIKAGLQGPAGSGKTLGALLLAYGLTKDWNKIAFIDTENRSASLYSNREISREITVGQFHTLQLEPPFTPERCVEAIDVCLKAEGIEAIVFDSISHEWNGKGGMLDLAEQMGKMNEMLKWGKLTPRHNRFIDEILRAPKHMILCMRSKQDYVMKEQTNSRGVAVVVPEKVGLKAVTKDGVDYEFTVNFDIDINNFATATKDRTAIFKGKPEFKITPETGDMILKWCESGVAPTQPAAKPEAPAEVITAAKAILEKGEKLQQPLSTTYTLTAKDNQSLQESVEIGRKFLKINVATEPELHELWAALTAQDQADIRIKALFDNRWAALKIPA